MKIIILCGGGGTRLWPISRRSKPKQFSSLINKKTLLEETLDRFKKEYRKNDLYISVSSEFETLVYKTLPKFPLNNIIIEPEKRDTGPAIGLASLRLSQKYPYEPIAFIPSDHCVSDHEKFIKSLKTAEALIKKTKKMIDIGVRPLFPSTVLGYLKIGKKYQEIDGINVYHFQGQKEKPKYALAKKYLEEGNYLWHAGYFMWTPHLFLGAYKKYAPSIYKHLERIKLLKDEKLIKKEYSRMPKISIDYALAERIDPRQVLIIKGEFGWSDIGAWDVLSQQLQSEADEKQNLIKAHWKGLDTSNTLIYGLKNKVIATIGIDDMIIVDTPDALLICPKGRSQDVKKIVEKLEKKYL